MQRNMDTKYIRREELDKLSIPNHRGVELGEVRNIFMRGEAAWVYHGILLCDAWPTYREYIIDNLFTPISLFQDSGYLTSVYTKADRKVILIK